MVPRNEFAAFKNAFGMKKGTYGRLQEGGWGLSCRVVMMCSLAGRWSCFRGRSLKGGISKGCSPACIEIMDRAGLMQR